MATSFIQLIQRMTKKNRWKRKKKQQIDEEKIRYVYLHYHQNKNNQIFSMAYMFLKHRQCFCIDKINKERKSKENFLFIYIPYEITVHGKPKWLTIDKMRKKANKQQTMWPLFFEVRFKDSFRDPVAACPAYCHQQHDWFHRIRETVGVCARVFRDCRPVVADLQSLIAP